MKCKVYLNSGEDHFFGFKNDFANDPKLHLAIEWDWDDDFVGPLMVSMVPHPHFLDHIWAELNMPVNSEFANAYRDERWRSLSVGDVVVLDESAWSCESHGWKRVTTDDFTKAIVSEVKQ